MATTIETEVEDLQEVVLKREPSAKSGSEKPKSLSGVPSRRFSRWILILIAAIAVAGASLWWVRSQNYESTDDAQVEGHLDLVSSRISGTVLSIDPKVENNRFVEAGTLLMELDPRDYAAELEQANLVAAQHKLRQDEAIYARAERDRVRYQALVEKHEISRSDYDARETEAMSAAQAVEADRAAIVSREQRIVETRSLVVQREAQIEAAHIAPQQVTDARAKSESAGGHMEQARADLHSAQLNLSYTKIYAPVSGVIGRKTVELGHRVQPGQGLLVIVPVDDIWITANFKETQLKRMRPGQSVAIRVDTFGRDYKGRVESLPGAAGPLFSLFPPENATGNYVKVVQRFPVRIRVDKDQDAEHLLRPGMSVEPAVKVH